MSMDGGGPTSGDLLRAMASLDKSRLEDLRSVITGLFPDAEQNSDPFNPLSDKIKAVVLNLGRGLIDDDPDMIDQAVQDLEAIHEREPLTPESSRAVEPNHTTPRATPQPIRDIENITVLLIQVANIQSASEK